MDVWMSYLVDTLKDSMPVCNFDLSERSAPRVSAVFLYSDRLKTLRARTLYVCPPDADLSGRTIPPDSYFIFPKAAMEHMPPFNAVFLENAPDTETIWNRLLDGMERYVRWHEHLTELVLAGVSPQRLLDEGTALLYNPILVQSADFMLIAVSGDATAADFPFFDFEFRRPRLEFLLRLNTHTSVQRQYRLKGLDNYTISTMDIGTLELHYAIHNAEDQIAGTIASVIRNKELTQGYLDLYGDFCSYMKRLLENVHLAPRTYPSALAIEQLLLDGHTSQLIELLGARTGWRFVIGVLETSRARMQQQSLLEQLPETLPHAIAFIHEARVCFAVCVSAVESEAVFAQAQYARIASFAGAADDLVGLSRPLDSLSDAREGLHQAERALHWTPLDGTRPAAAYGTSVRFYADIAICDMLSVYLEGKRMECYLPPEIAARYRDDLSSGDNNIDILYHYMTSNKSLASTSKAFHMHRNTIAYRIKRMAEVYGIRSDSADLNTDYLLACLLCKFESRKITAKAPAPDTL